MGACHPPPHTIGPRGCGAPTLPTASWAAPWRRRSRVRPWRGSMPGRRLPGGGCGFRKSRGGSGDGRPPGEPEGPEGHRSEGPGVSPLRLSAFSRHLHPPGLGRARRAAAGMPVLRKTIHYMGAPGLTSPLGLGFMRAPKLSVAKNSTAQFGVAYTSMRERLWKVLDSPRRTQTTSRCMKPLCEHRPAKWSPKRLQLALRGEAQTKRHCT